MTDYSFFNYRTNEALHLSVREKQVIGDCMDAIGDEIRNSADDYSMHVISKRIGLLLDYGMRFYERQFITRYLTVQTTIKQYETLVRDSISVNGLGAYGRLSLRNCAERLGLSEAYFCDMLRYETGMSHGEYTNCQCVIFAQKLLRETKYPVARIASDLGFLSARHFSLFFKKIVGCSPNEFRYSC